MIPFIIVLAFLGLSAAVGIIGNSPSGAIYWAMWAIIIILMFNVHAPNY